MDANLWFDSVFDKPCYNGLVRILIAQAVLALLFWLGSFVAASKHAFFYLDYLYLPFIFRCHRILGIVAAALMVFFDFYFSIDAANGLSLIALLGLVREIPHAGLWGYQLSIFGTLLFAVMLFWVVKQYSQVTIRAALIALLIMGLIYYPAKKIMKWPILSTGLTGPLFYALFLKDTFFFTRLNPIKMHFTPLTSPSWLAQNAHSSPKILSIIVESYGLYKIKPHINAYFEELLHKGLPNRRIYVGTVIYQGSTVNAELRELCSIVTEGVMLDTIPAHYKCLPEYFAKKGYTTVAFHNNKGGFYDRTRWYPSVGFTHFIDRNSMVDKGYPLSNHAFGGIADKSMTQEIAKWFTQHSRLFAHWVTLDSHGPYTQIPAADDIDCRQLQITDTVECNYVNTLSRTLKTIVALAQAYPDIKIVISGDHAPHFEMIGQPVVGKRINAFFDKARVPAFVIDSTKSPR